MNRLLSLLKTTGFSTRRLLKTTFLVVLFYLVQVNIVPYAEFSHVMPNLHMVIIAILTVSCGKKFAFASGALTGILLEAMGRNINSFYVLIYPTLAMIFAQLFADMTEFQREYRRYNIQQKREKQKLRDSTKPSLLALAKTPFRRNASDDMNPHLRILLNALALHAAYEVTMMVYVGLNGVSVGGYHIVKLIKSCLYTGVWCVWMFPVRWFLGMYKKRAVKQVGEAFEQAGEGYPTADLKALAVIPDSPTADSLRSFELRMEGEVTRVGAHGDARGDEKRDGAAAPPEPQKEKEGEPDERRP